MLFTVYNLPINFTYNDVKLLMSQKCGLTDMVLDNFMVHGNRRKVTVGVRDPIDATSLFQNIDGLFLNGEYLHVEEMKKRVGTEQSYTPARRMGSISYTQDPNGNRSNNNSQQPGMFRPNNFVSNLSRPLLQTPTQQSRMGMGGPMNYNAGPTGYMRPQVPWDNRDPYARNSADTSQRYPEQNNQWLPPRESAYQSFNRGAINDYNSRNAAEYDNFNVRHDFDDTGRGEPIRNKRPYDRNDPIRLAKRAELGKKLKSFASSLLPPPTQHEDSETELPESDQQNLDEDLDDDKPHPDKSQALGHVVKKIMSFIFMKLRRSQLHQRTHAPFYMLMKESIHNRVVEIVAQKFNNDISNVGPNQIRKEYLKIYPEKTFLGFLKASIKSSKRIKQGREPTSKACKKLALQSESESTALVQKYTEGAGAYTTEAAMDPALNTPMAAPAPITKAVKYPYDKTKFKTHSGVTEFPPAYEQALQREMGDLRHKYNIALMDHTDFEGAEENIQNRLRRNGWAALDTIFSFMLRNRLIFTSEYWNISLSCAERAPTREEAKEVNRRYCSSKLSGPILYEGNTAVLSLRTCQDYDKLLNMKTVKIGNSTFTLEPHVVMPNEMHIAKVIQSKRL